MKHLSYALSDSDIEAILFAFSILPSIDIEQSEAQASINYQCCRSATEKLCNRETNITPNELRIIYAALQAVQFICRGELYSSPETKKQCMNYLFTVNKLISVLSPLLEPLL